MKIIVNRDSVCMGDDCFDHAKSYMLGDDATYMDLFECLKTDIYFPSCNNVVWVLTNKHHDCIFSYFTKTDKLSMGLAEKSLKTICKDSNKLLFEYYSSPQKWKDTIYHIYNNDEHTMYKDGWLEEIKYCDFLMNL